MTTTAGAYRLGVKRLTVVLEMKGGAVQLGNDSWAVTSGLREDLADHMAVDVGQAAVDAVLANGQLLVIDA